MAAERENLRDLIESRAAEHGVPLRKLWKWTLRAILSDVITPIFPEGKSLDVPFCHGGRSLTWRTVIKTLLPTIDGYGPLDSNWTTQMQFDVASFDRWLTTTLETQGIPNHPKRAAGRKRRLRKRLASFIAEQYPLGVPAGITRKKIATDFNAATGICASERSVGRAVGRK